MNAAGYVESFKAAYKALHGHDIHVSSRSNGRHFVDGSFYTTREIAAKAERLWLSVNARNATRSEYTA